MYDPDMRDMVGMAVSDPRLPAGIELQAALSTGSVAVRMREVLALTRALGLPEVVSWYSSMAPRVDIEGSEAELHAQLSGMGAQLLGACATLANGTDVYLSREEECVFLALTMKHGAWAPLDVAGGIELLWQLTADLVRGQLTRTAVVVRLGDRCARCLPDLPLARRAAHISVASHAMIQRLFHDTDRALEAGWDRVERLGEVWMLGRAMGAAHNRDFLDAVLDGHWRLARLARRGLALFDGLPPDPEAHDLYMRGAATLQELRYNRAKAEITFGCEPHGGASIPGWELDHLRRMGADGMAPDGRRVRRIVLVFTNSLVAQREQRLLRELGVKVRVEELVA